MSGASGGGNRNLFSIEEAQAEPGRSDAYSLALDTNNMIAIRGGALRFYHLALRDHFAFRYAQDAIHDPDPTIRDSAAWALWQIPDRRAVDLLLEALGDPYPRDAAKSLNEAVSCCFIAAGDVSGVSADGRRARAERWKFSR